LVNCSIGRSLERFRHALHCGGGDIVEQLLPLIRRHHRNPRWLAVIVVADTVVAAIGIAGDMQWRFFEAMIFDRPAKAGGPVVRSTANVVVLACPSPSSIGAAPRY
jgi:hypothetical protein